MKNLFTLILANRREKSGISFMLPFLLTTIFLVAFGVAKSQPNTWTGAVNNNWNTAGNWSLGIPTLDHDVLINQSATISVNAASTINSLTINNSATVVFTSSPGNRTVTIDNSGSTIAAGSSLTLQGNATPGFMRISFSGAGNTMAIAGTLSLKALGGGGAYSATNSLTTVTGVIKKDGTGGGTVGLITSGAANLSFSAGSTYIHAANGGDVPKATWNAGSTCSVTGITNNACTGLSQNFHTLSWNCPAQTVAVEIGTASRTFAGNIEIQNTGTGSLIYCNEPLATGAATLTIGENFILNGGTFNLSTSTCTRPINLKLLGNFTMNGGTLTKESTTVHNVNFNKTGTQDFSKTGGTITGDINFRILSGSTLNMGSNILDGSTANFALLGGGAINTAHPEGLADAGTSAGSIQVGGTRAYGTTADYIYSGTSAQVTGTGPGTCNNLTIDNASGVSFSNVLTTVNGTLLINSGKLLVINPTKRLTVNGTITNNAGSAGLLIQSDNSGTGSLIANSSAVNATVERYITGGRWHFISSPVSGAVSGMFAGKYLQKFDEPTNTYSDITTLTEPLVPVKGFALWGDAAGFTSQFTGTLNTGNLSQNLTRSVSPGEGWNLVGNPYPCAIDWDAAGWTKTNINNAIYIERNGSWATYISGVGTLGGTQFIASGQGFMVNVATTPGTLGISDAVKLHRPTTTYFKNTNSGSLVRLEVSGNNYTDEAIVRFLPEVTAEFDGQYDAYKLFGYVDESAQIYTLGSTPLTINSTVPGTREIPLGIRANTAGTYTIAATELAEIPVLSLEDSKTGIFTDLLSKPYSFAFEPGENEVRFKLHFGTTSVNEKELLTTDIYSFQKSIFVNLKNQEEVADIFIYNIAGQLIYSRSSVSGMNEFNLSQTGNYIVKVISKENSQVKKVFIQ